MDLFGELPVQKEVLIFLLFNMAHLTRSFIHLGQYGNLLLHHCRNRQVRKSLSPFKTRKKLYFVVLEFD